MRPLGRRCVQHPCHHPAGLGRSTQPVAKSPAQEEEALGLSVASVILSLLCYG